MTIRSANLCVLCLILAATAAGGQPMLRRPTLLYFGFRLERRIDKDEVTVYPEGLYASVRITPFEEKDKKVKGFLFHLTGISGDACVISVPEAKVIETWVNHRPIIRADDGRSFKNATGTVFTLESGEPMSPATRNVEGPLQWTKQEGVWRMTDYADSKRPETKRTWVMQP